MPIKKKVLSKRAVKKVVKKKALSKPAKKNKKASSGKPSKGVIKGGKVLEKIGVVIHYFHKAKAAAIRIVKNALEIGDAIHIKGHTTDFKEKIVSLQLDHVPVRIAKKGDEVGLLVKSRVRVGDTVYRA